MLNAFLTVENDSAHIDWQNLRCPKARSSEPLILVGTDELVRPSFDEVETELQVFQRLLHGLVLHAHGCQALVFAAINRLRLIVSPDAELLRVLKSLPWQ